MTREWIVSEEDLGCDGAYFSYTEVVRCKDCKWYNPKGDDPYFLFDFWCDNDDGMWNPSPESFCSFGERRKAND